MLSFEELELEELLRAQECDMLSKELTDGKEGENLIVYDEDNPWYCRDDFFVKCPL